MNARTAVRPPAEARDVLVSVNPRAGVKSRRDRTQAISRAIEEAGFHVRVVAELPELAELALRGWQEGRLRAVVAMGGDGTASLVRNRVPLEVPLLPVPMGTENLLGSYVVQSAEPKEVVETLRNGVIGGLDLGRAGERYFLLMISAGFDAEVIRRLDQTRKGNISRLSYVKPTLATVRSYAYPELQVYCEGGPSPDGGVLRCRWLFAFNLPLYACGWQIAPRAVGTDGLLDVCAFQRGSLLGVMRYLWHVTCRRHELLSDATTCQGRRIRIEAAGAEDVAYQLDGDWGGILPVDVEVLTGQLRLLVSPATATRLGFALPSETVPLASPVQS